MTTTNANITDSQISQLRREAEEAGDDAMLGICLRALGGDPAEAEAGTALAECSLTVDEARAECARVISDAEAMA